MQETSQDCAQTLLMTQIERDDALLFELPLDRVEHVHEAIVSELCRHDLEVTRIIDELAQTYVDSMARCSVRDSHE